MKNFTEQVLYAGLGYGVILPMFVIIFATVATVRVANAVVQLPDQLIRDHMTTTSRR